MTYSEFRNQFSNVENFMRAYGALTAEESKALIDAENASPRTKFCLIAIWHEARKIVKLQNVKVNLHDDHSLTIVFYEDDSDFDGNDFEYRYLLDADYTNIFIKTIPQPYYEIIDNIEEWLCDNIHCDGLGSDLQQQWVKMGLHGSHVVVEDYPGGIYREEMF